MKGGEGAKGFLNPLEGKKTGLFYTKKKKQEGVARGKRGGSSLLLEGRRWKAKTCLREGKENGSFLPKPI